METQPKHMYSLYTGSLSNVAFPMACFTCIVTSVIRENLNAINEALHWALPFIWAGKTLILWKVFIFKLKAYFFGKGTQWELIDEKRKIFSSTAEKIQRKVHDTFCLLFCLEFFIPLENFSLIWRRHHCRWKAANFDLCSALIAIEQWGFFSVPHILLWHGASIYYGHLRGPVTLTHYAERMTKVCRGWNLNTQPSACGLILKSGSQQLDTKIQKYIV